MDADGPDESFNIALTDPDYTRTATTLVINDPEAEDVEVCSAEPPTNKNTSKKLKGADQVPSSKIENPSKRTSLPINGVNNTTKTAVEVAPKKSLRRIEAQAKAAAAAAATAAATAAAAAATAAAQQNKREQSQKAKKKGPKPRAPIPFQKPSPGKKDKRGERLLAIREAAEKAAAVGSLTPPAPPSPAAADFVDEEIIRSAEKKKKQLEEKAKILAEKLANKNNATNLTNKRKTRGEANALEEENEDDEDQQIEILMEAGPSKQAKDSSRAKKKNLKEAAETTTTRRSKRSRGDEQLPNATAAAAAAGKATTVTPAVGPSPADALAELPAMDALTANEVAETAGAVDLSAPPSAALLTTNTTNDDNDEGAPVDVYADKDPACAARDWIMAALANPRGKEASSAFLRESLENSVETIISNIEGTISNGQNNSLLVLGGRGAGKTLAVERALTSITTQWNTDSADPLVGIVRLVGWAHADERTAFKEIARQLCGTFQLQFSRTASLGDNIEFLRHVLDGLARAHKVAVFVLDDFDLFARRAKQTLLYCLLDALQTSGVQAVVLGTTVRHDCLDLLEKRVKSRLSHRSVMISPPSGAQTIEPATTAASPGSAAAAMATSPGAGGADDLPKEGSIEILRKMLTLPDCFPRKQHIKAHNTAVKAAVSHKTAIKALTEFATYRTSLHDLRNIAQATIATSSTHPKGLITQEAIVKACTNLSKASDLGMEGYIAGLSVLELAVLVGAHRAARRVDGDPINFEMAFKEFYTYSTSGEHVDNYTKGAACKAFFKLTEMGLLSPSTGKADARVVSGNHFAPMYVQITALELRTGISVHQTCPAKLKDWAIREGGPLTTAAANLE